MKKVLIGFQEHDIPLDTQVADIDHYDERKDFTVDPIKWAGLADYFKHLKSIGMKTVMILDPAIIVNNTNYWPYETARENNVFIKWPGYNPDYSDTNSSIMLGFVSFTFIILGFCKGTNLYLLGSVLAKGKGSLSGLFQEINTEVVD